MDKTDSFRLAPPNSSSIFLAAADVQILTGWSVRTKQIAALRKLGISFFINPATGRPIVPTKSIEGEKLPAIQHPWAPAVIGGSLV